MLSNGIALIAIAALFGVEAFKSGGRLARVVLTALAVAFALGGAFINPLSDRVPDIGELISAVFGQPVAWFVLCVALFFVARPLWSTPKAAKVSPRDKAAWLAENARRLSGRINNHRHWSSGVMEMRDPLEKVVRDGISLLISFEKAGYAVPELADLDTYQKVAVGMQTYFLAVGPLLRDGHLEEAQRVAPQFAKDARAEARSLS